MSELGSCENPHCYRSADMTMRYGDTSGTHEIELCLACRTILELGAQIQWNTETDRWRHPDVLDDFRGVEW